MSETYLAALVRGENLLGIDQLVRERGGKVERFFTRVGLPSDVHDSPSTWVSFSAFTELLELAARELDYPLFGLMLAEQQQALPLGVYGQLMVRSPNMADAFDMSAKYRALHSQAVEWQLEVQGEQALLSRHYVAETSSSNVQHSLYSLRKLTLMIEALMGGEWHPSAVYFRHSVPGGAKPISRRLRCPVYLEQEIDGLICAAQELRKPLPGSDAELLIILTDYASRLMSEQNADTTVSSKTRQLIQQTMASGNCTLEVISGQLNLHPAQLYRQLKNEGESFRSLLSSVRQQTATQFLSKSHIPLTELAIILGYSELSAFSRAFYRYHGVYPEQWREHYRKTPPD